MSLYGIYMSLLGYITESFATSRACFSPTKNCVCDRAHRAETTKSDLAHWQRAKRPGADLRPLVQAVQACTPWMAKA